MRTTKLAAAQLGPATDDKEATVARMMVLAQQAADEGVNVLLFPELALTPFFAAGLDGDFDKWFDDLPSPLIQGLLDIARKAEMVLVLPYAERAGSYYYNSSLVIDADGQLLGKYRKVHIPGYFPSDVHPSATGSYERLYFRPSDDGFPVFPTRYGVVGVQICYDRMFPEGSRILALKGAEIVAFPNNYSTYGKGSRVGVMNHSVVARSYENGFFSILANKAGIEGLRENTGRSMISSPLGGEVLAEASESDEELITAECDLDDVTNARRSMPWWRDRRPDLYGEIIAPRATP
jgi:predicted amidohydrolase